MKLLIGTTNPGKLAEVRALLEELPLEVATLADFADAPAVEEDGLTFEENALKKARTWARFSGRLTLADDSGLEVDALDGAPGIRSARYAGEPGDDDENNRKLLAELRDVPEEKRTARFICALALCAPRDGEFRVWTVRASCEGRILSERRGDNGFGYDPLFFYPPLGKTFGEIDRGAKAAVSHRGKALKKLKELLRSVVEMSLKP